MNISYELADLDRAHAALDRLTWGGLPRTGVRDALDHAPRIATNWWKDRNEAIALGMDGCVWHLATRRHWGTGSPEENYRVPQAECFYYARRAQDRAEAAAAVRAWADAYAHMRPAAGRRAEHADQLARVQDWLARHH